MDILVTGCAGFIGWKVTESLIEAGHRVVGVDNLNDAYDVRLKEWRLSELENLPGFAFHHLDITNRAALEALFADAKGAKDTIDAVVNLAARAGVRASVENPKAFYKTNLDGTLALLEFCRKREVKKFVLASTSSLYGSHNEMPFQEDADTSRPLSPYAASKKAAETLCYTYHYLHGLDVTALRYFTVYGPAGRPDMSIFRFIQWIAEGRPVIIYDDGRQQRDFTFVEDIARGTVAALKPLGFEVLNLGSESPVALLDVVRRIEEQLGRKAQLRHEPAHYADVRVTWADSSRARSALGWEPKVSLEEGLSQAVAWYQRNQAWAASVATA